MDSGWQNLKQVEQIKDGNAVGNASSSSSEQQYAPDSTTIAKKFTK